MEYTSITYKLNSNLQSATNSSTNYLLLMLLLCYYVIIFIMLLFYYFVISFHYHKIDLDNRFAEYLLFFQSPSIPFVRVK